jgi:hypothetical protein
LILSRQINVLTSSQGISHVNVELETNVSEISSLSIIRVDVVNDHPAKSVPYPSDVLCGRREEAVGDDGHGVDL